ncbi:hypothetical protein EX30DRAFT_397823 [Ascodesmis nigricans]|uniref:Uncharacterized protein n=1 Tax=Ascodesmis nigricans TaxID=341454 RepID=A0A4S2MMK8_9PEZI|nr:hypothetical protein EX30DRAFT_397823 [Ascodesmis nigricans]
MSHLSPLLVAETSHDDFQPRPQPSTTPPPDNTPRPPRPCMPQLIIDTSLRIQCCNSVCKRISKKLYHHGLTDTDTLIYTDTLIFHSSVDTPWTCACLHRFCRGCQMEMKNKWWICHGCEMVNFPLWSWPGGEFCRTEGCEYPLDAACVWVWRDADAEMLAEMAEDNLVPVVEGKREFCYWCFRGY